MRPSFRMSKVAKTDLMLMNLSEPTIIILQRRERKSWLLTKFSLLKTMVKVNGTKQLFKWLKKLSKTNIKTRPQRIINRVHRIEYKIRININKR
jgi:hypothetical protein